MERLIAILMLAREVAHREHLRTGSYSQHMALGDFYEGVGGHADGLTEAYQGRTLRLLSIPQLVVEQPADIVAFLQGQVREIEGLRYEAVAREDTTIQNMIDDALGLYLSTIYKLAFLA